MSAFAPQIFGKYFLVDKIATGGMAEIFKAKTYSHGGFENLVVIKRILQHLGESEEFVEMFIDEAKVSVALQHPNIVRIYDFGKILDNYFIAMECVDGKDVRAVMRKLATLRQSMDPKLAAYIAFEGARGLDYAHQKKDADGNGYRIVHRDISPSNLLVSYEGQVKVADFGIAKAQSNAYQTQGGVLKGKYEYMSPEQAEGQELDGRSDVFSLGIVLWETLTGRRLFKTDNDLTTLQRIKDADVPPPSKYQSNILPQLDAVVLKALTRDRDERYESGDAFANDLREIFAPESPDQLQKRLAAFIHEIFADEIAAEKERLAEGSRAAIVLREQLGPAEAWDGSPTDSTVGLTAPPIEANTNWMFPLVALALVMGVIVGTGAVVAVVAASAAGGAFQQAPPAQLPVVEVGDVDVMVSPAAAIVFDGREVAVGTGWSALQVAAGPHELNLMAEGYEPVAETLTVAPGQRLTIERVLKPVAPATPEPQPPAEPVVAAPKPKPDGSPAPTPKPAALPVLSFRSDPPGATVQIDGKTVGTTPFDWTGAEALASVRVHAELAGHKPLDTTVKAPNDGAKATETLRFEALATAGGSLKIVLDGGGWANVWVDGVKQKKTAPLSLDLSPGPHEIRVENEALGLAHTETVTVTSGQKSTLQVKPQ